LTSKLHSVNQPRSPNNRKQRPKNGQKAGFLHHSPCQTFSVVMAPSFWFFKATRFIRFACKVARDPQERTGAGVAVRQLDPMAACRTASVSTTSRSWRWGVRSVTPRFYAAYLDSFFWHSLP
jgi:hypothetical protein